MLNVKSSPDQIIRNEELVEILPYAHLPWEEGQQGFVGPYLCKQFESADTSPSASFWLPYFI